MGHYGLNAVARRVRPPLHRSRCSALLPQTLRLDQWVLGFVAFVADSGEIVTGRCLETEMCLCRVSAIAEGASGCQIGWFVV